MCYILDKLYSEHTTLVNKNRSIKYFEKFSTQQIYNATKKEELTKEKKTFWRVWALIIIIYEMKARTLNKI